MTTPPTSHARSGHAGIGALLSRAPLSQVARGHRRSGAVLALTISAAVAVSGCTSSGTTSAGAGGGDADSETLTLGLDVAPSSFDPGQLSSGGSTVLPWQAVYDTLLRWAPDGTVVPNAAEEFEFTEDNTLLTLTLREGMTFTDGTPVDAAAVVASLEHARDSGGPDAARLADAVIEAPDESTVTIRVPSPRPLLPTYLTLSSGVIASPASLDDPDLATEPVGSGPYELDVQRTTSGDTWTFVRNEDYWNAEDYAYDTVVFRLMEDITARMSALRSGQIDAAPVTSQTAAEAEAAGLTLLDNQVNWNGLVFADRDGSTVPALGDVRVRQAISMAFDREAVLEALYQGRGTVTNQIFNPESAAYDEELLGRYEQDLEQARALMAEAGYADGFDLTIPDVAGFNQANPLLVSTLGELGIRVTQETLSPDQAYPAILSGQYPLFWFGLESRTALWDIDQAVLPSATWNLEHTVSPELEPLLEQVLTASGDEADELYRQINEQVVEEAWFAPMVFVTDSWAFDDDTAAEPVLGSQAPYLYTFE